MKRKLEAAIMDPPYFFWGGHSESPHHQGGFPPSFRRGGGIFLFGGRVRRFWWMWLLCHLVSMNASAENTEPTPVEEASADMEDVEVLKPSAQEQIEEAVALRRIGAFDAAQDMLNRARDSAVTALDQLEYQQGILFETTEQWDKAVIAYTIVSDQYPKTATSADARFRLAYCLEELGRHKESIRMVKRLRASGTWTADDERSMALQQGIVEIRAGKERRGIKRLVTALDSPADKRTWIRAKARLALVRVQLKTAADIKISGDKKAARRLKARDALMTAAEKQAIAMFHLGEPEFALEGLLLLGDSYMDLYGDMVSYAPPRSVGPELHEQYREIVEQKARILLTKAYNRYDEGVRVAARTHWVGSVTKRLEAKRDDLRDVLEPSSSESATESAVEQEVPNQSEASVSP
jgi:tetratricopeptide (TPR) repeat protein